jgi:diguanylate cyclase (GGDEF)-like protein
MTDALSLTPLLGTVPHDLAKLGRPAVIVPASTACPELERVFAFDPGLSSVTVRSEESDRLGLLSRASFAGALSGRLGYGRPLLQRELVGNLADWDALVVDAETPVPLAVQAAMSRPGEQRHDDVLVRLGEHVVVVQTARLITTLAGMFASRAMRDTLTGLSNRDVFFATLDEACRHAGETASYVAVVYLDLDGFKRTNDGHGHPVGDALLVAVGQQLRGAVRDGEAVARLGGDEFAAILSLPATVGDAEQVARSAAERIRAAVSATEPPRPGVSTTPSVGVALSRRGQASAETLVREADLAMYRAKRRGGDQVQAVADVGPELVTSLVSGLSDAVIDGQLRLHYQPIVRLEDGRTISVEALVRWQHPRLGLIAPDRFLSASSPAAEARLLDEWVLGQACRDFVAMTGPEGPRFLNVNITPATLGHHALADTVLAATEAAGMSPTRLRLEVPESAGLNEVLSAGAQLARLREAGVCLTLDDMGSGSSSLRHISRIKVDGLKIDRSFVSGITDNERDVAVVRMLVDLAAGLGLQVTAEGVETEEQLELLRSLGCPFGQGYLLGRPAPYVAGVAALSAG